MDRIKRASLSILIALVVYTVGKALYYWLPVLFDSITEFLCHCYDEAMRHLKPIIYP